MMARSYEIKPRPTRFGGGWILTMLEDGEEMGRGVYPLPDLPEPFTDDDEYQFVMDALHAEAQAEGESWQSGEGLK